MGAPDAPQRGRKLNPKLFFSVDVVLNKTHGLGSPAGMFGVLGVSTAGKSSSSLIQNTFQVLISVSFGARETESTWKASRPHWHLSIRCLQGTSAQVPWQHKGHKAARISPSTALSHCSTHAYN